MSTPPEIKVAFADLPEPIVLKTVRNRYHTIQINQHSIYGGQLIIDGDLQISESDHAYGKAMVSPLIAQGRLGRIIILGGGDGGVLNEVLTVAETHALAFEAVTLIDIDQDVIELSKTYLPKLCGTAFEHTKTTVLIADAFQFLSCARNLDGVIYDLTMDPVRTNQNRLAFIDEIMTKIAESLCPGGMLSMQCCGEGAGSPSLKRENSFLLQEIRSVVSRNFTGLTEQQVLIPSYQECWTFLSATKA